MFEVSMTFRGICTHLMTRHEHGKAPEFDLWTDDIPIQHRIVLANSGLIATHIDPSRGVVPHLPALRIQRNDVTDDLAGLLEEKDHCFELALKDVAIGFNGLDPTKGPHSHRESLGHLPKLWDRADHPVYLRPGVRRGWTRHAGAYIDFTGGVSFLAMPVDQLAATLVFRDEPQMVVRQFNTGPGRTYRLKPGTHIEISNLPSECCSASDYLLHYFVTTLDLCEDAPVWTPEISSETKIEAIAGRKPRTEVYCSNSAYP